MHFLFSKQHFLPLATASDMSYLFLLLSFLLLIDIEHFSTPMRLCYWQTCKWKVSFPFSFLQHHAIYSPHSFDCFYIKHVPFLGKRNMLKDSKEPYEKIHEIATTKIPFLSIPQPLPKKYAMFLFNMQSCCLYLSMSE